jgi:hypothetical protein
LLGGLFDVPGGGAGIAIRRRRYARLIAAGSAAGRGPLGAPPSDASRGGILKLLAHAIELRRVLRAEPAAGQCRRLTVTSTTTTHRPFRIAEERERTFRVNDYLPVVPAPDCPRFAGDFDPEAARERRGISFDGPIVAYDRPERAVDRVYLRFGISW